MTTEEYKRFMSNSANVRKCEQCPENRGADNFQDRLPCGQRHCWVSLHCKKGAEA